MPGFIEDLPDFLVLLVLGFASEPGSLGSLAATSRELASLSSSDAAWTPALGCLEAIWCPWAHPALSMGPREAAAAKAFFSEVGGPIDSCFMDPRLILDIRGEMMAMPSVKARFRALAFHVRRCRHRLRAADAETSEHHYAIFASELAARDVGLSGTASERSLVLEAVIEVLDRSFALGGVFGFRDAPAQCARLDWFFRPNGEANLGAFPTCSNVTRATVDLICAALEAETPPREVADVVVWSPMRPVPPYPRVFEPRCPLPPPRPDSNNSEFGGGLSGHFWLKSDYWEGR